MACCAGVAGCGWRGKAATGYWREREIRRLAAALDADAVTLGTANRASEQLRAQQRERERERRDLQQTVNQRIIATMLACRENVTPCRLAGSKPAPAGPR